MATIDSLKIVRATQTSAQGKTINPNDMILMEADAGLVADLLKMITGYNGSVAQTLKHDNTGAIKWVNG